MFGIFKSKKQTALQPIGFKTDVHAHILPGIDDGADNLEESLELIRSLKTLGIERVIATPHITEEVFPNEKKTIGEAYQQLRTALDAEGIQFDVKYSAEYRLDGNFLSHWERNDLIPFPKNFLLIENSYLQPYWRLEETIFELHLAGYKPILAHPERYTYYHNDFAVFDKLHALNCKFQVNILSLAGVYGKEVKKTALHLLNKGYINFLATDVHHMRHIKAMEEFLQTSEFEKISAKLNLLNDTL
ncbi:tyrosine-protein phosphatase [Parabacteroides sp. FAFU027]|uniref:tyrosine-protein phosphatase n=1 Tax=Parabacteroides sp. FAFU027 TaxID=2922715 RepID=UPI001FB03FC0|nr:CpsB/CapC family capsule biosynthesis tyrosine phosphatase [Parabacteroides sp. FAFU027]